MNLTARSLSERLNRLESGRTAHDEYIPSLVESIKASRITEYLGGYDEEQEHIKTRMGLSAAAMNQWTYRDMAAYIADRYNSSVPSVRATACDLMDLLAVPMLDVHRLKQERQRREDGQ